MSQTMVLLRPAVFAAAMLLSGVTTATAWGQSAPPQFYPDDPLWQDDDMLDCELVREEEIGQLYDFLSNQFGDPGAGGEGLALNANTVGGVADSSWFTNRIGRRSVSSEEARQGAVVHGPPAPGVWTVVGRPGSGVSVKFTIEDTQGIRYLLKFDPVEVPGTVSSAEVIASRLFYLLGYNTPENTLVYLDLTQLQIAPGVTFKDELGYKRPLRWKDLQEWLREVAREPDGRIRAVASRWITGTPAGPFRYYGTRPDDPNDIYPHQHRRELRGLRVFGAWLNHDDSRALNSGDFYVQENDRRFLRHYLMDFGSVMGSSSLILQPRRGGYEYFFEGGKILKSIFTLGLWEREWAKIDYPDLYGVGRFEADEFQPWLWKPNYPNPAFERMDTADAFWAARVLSRISDELIAAAVDAGRIPDPAARDYLIDTLARRRDKVVRYWISRTNPIDTLRLVETGGELTLGFENAALRTGATARDADYRVEWARLDNLTGSEEPVGPEHPIADRRARVPENAWGQDDGTGARYATARISALHPDFPQWQQPVVVTLRRRGDEIELVGVARPAVALDNRPDLRAVGVSDPGAR